jgi:hypothetical protein
MSSELPCPICRLPCKSEKQANSSIKNAAEIYYCIGCDRCGEYKISFSLFSDCLGKTPILSELRDDYKGKEYILSGVTRNNSERGKTTVISYKNIVYLIDNAPTQTTPLEILDRMVAYVAEKSAGFKSDVEIDAVKDYTLFYTKSADDLNYVIATTNRHKYLNHKNRRFSLTPEGWEHAHQILLTNLYSKRAFVAMWFNDEMKVAYSKAIKPAVEKTGYEAYNVGDDLSNTDMIVNKIIAEIRRSRFLIIDLTGLRRSVIFEAGFALGLDIPVIWTCRQKCKDYMDKKKNKTSFRH